jgi:endoglucanase
VFSKRRVSLNAGVLCLEALAGLFAFWQLNRPDAAVAPAPQLHVSSNQLVNANGQAVVLHGVDRSGGEFSCVHGTGIWDGPMDQAAVTAMRSWGVNAVRVPLNEACWNGQSYVQAAYRGVRYRDAVEAYVRLLNRNGIVAILDLHWSDGAYAHASCQSADAQTFKANDAVLFDVFNEPYPTGGSEAAEWTCWLRGGSACTSLGIGYPVAGMQTLVSTIRATGAGNVILLSGLRYANDLTGWKQYEPADPDHNLAASWHSYNFNACVTEACWEQQIAPVAAKVPLVATEIGETGCTDSYIDPLMTWLDARNIGYLAWAWNADFACSSGPGLISSYGGTPTSYGQGYLAHLKSLK